MKTLATLFIAVASLYAATNAFADGDKTVILNKGTLPVTISYIVCSDLRYQSDCVSGQVLTQTINPAGQFTVALQGEFSGVVITEAVQTQHGTQVNHTVYHDASNFSWYCTAYNYEMLSLDDGGSTRIGCYKGYGI